MPTHAGHPNLYKIHELRGLSADPVAAQSAAPSRVATRIDVAFQIILGPMGEDGTVHGLFELADASYVMAGRLGWSE